MIQSLKRPLSLFHVLSEQYTKDEQREKCLPFWSSNGCTQILTPLPTKSVYRTIDGRLVDLTPSTHRKYTTVILCQDQYGSPLENLWSGMSFWVDCIQHLSLPLSSPPPPYSVRLSRQPVPDSVVLQRPGLPSMTLNSQEREVALPQDYPLESMLIYRPRLLMRLTYFQFEVNETEMQTKWRLELAES